jgi:hypothetical protein
MSTDVMEWCVERPDSERRGRYLADLMAEGDRDVLLWTDNTAEAWRLEKRDAEAYAVVSYSRARVIHETELVGSPHKRSDTEGT